MPAICERAVYTHGDGRTEEVCKVFGTGGC